MVHSRIPTQVPMNKNPRAPMRQMSKREHYYQMNDSGYQSVPEMSFPVYVAHHFYNQEHPHALSHMNMTSMNNAMESHPMHLTQAFPKEYPPHMNMYRSIPL